MTQSDLWLVELHDADLSTISFDCDSGGGLVAFDHLCVYLPAGDRRFAVWSHKAHLVLSGITIFHLDGVLNSTSRRVLDDEVETESGPVVNVGLLIGAPHRGFRLMLAFGSGTRLRLQSEWAHLELGERLGFVDYFLEQGEEPTALA